MNALEIINDISRRLIRGCVHETPSGVRLFTPDGVASYDALWLRDFSYMVEYVPECVTDDELENALIFALDGARADGWLPDRRYADGLTVYAAGGLRNPVGRANLDNTPFGVFLMYEHVKRRGGELFAERYSLLEKGMLAIPRSVSGLVYNDPAGPHSPYGFTDTVCKTGELFMESLIFHRACIMLVEMCAKFIPNRAVLWKSMADEIETAIQRLYDEETGLFLAASRDCAQPDIWGNAYAVYTDFPLGERRASVLNALERMADKYLYKGQVRHLVKGTYWEKLLIDVPPETYQNGAYWATATGWAAWCLYLNSREKGLKTLAEAIRFLNEEGSFECVNEGYAKLSSFVVSASNIRGAAERIINIDSAACDELTALIEGGMI